MSVTPAVRGDSTVLKPLKPENKKHTHRKYFPPASLPAYVRSAARKAAGKTTRTQPFSARMQTHAREPTCQTDSNNTLGMAVCLVGYVRTLSDPVG